MTGAVEAASLALAVLPIVISVSENFCAAARALKRYRHFSSEVGHLSKLVRLQKTIFHGEIRLLLASCVGWDQAEQLLQDTDQEEWNDKDLEESFVARLGNIREPFLELVQWINAELSKMEDKLSGFEEVVQLTEEGSRRNDRRWRHQIGEKSRFALSRSPLQESMNTLKELIESLRTLVSQTERSEQRRPSSRPSAQARQVMQQFALVQNTSQNLYEALRTACTKHTQHQAHFGLQPIPMPRAHQVRFSVGFRHVVASAPSSKQTSWFTVESSVTPAADALLSSTLSKPFTILGQSIKRGRTPSPPPPESQPSKLRETCIRFQLPSPPSSRSPVITCRVPEIVPQPPLANLCSHSNFCNHLKNFLSRSSPHSEGCIGYLEHSSKTKHLIYLQGQEPTPKQHCDVPAKSLAELLDQYQGNSDETAGIAQYERLRLAGKLATAVLQFYSTPWLRNSWGSSDVLFQLQESTSVGQIECLKEPFVDVSVRDQTIAIDGGLATTCYPFAPNDFLFGLGVMLLELAYQKPLRSMQQPCDIANSQDERHTLFFTAKRLSRLVSAKLGSRYGEIVRKCLACDFGRGDDLGQPALQEGVYREVVCELTELEKLLRDMNIGP